MRTILTEQARCQRWQFLSLKMLFASLLLAWLLFSETNKALSQTKKVFQKDHAIKNAFLKSTSLAKTQTRLTKSSQAPLVISRRLLEKKPKPASSPPSFWRRPSRWGAISNSKSPPNGNGAKRDTQPKGSNFIPQQNKLTPTYPSRRS